MSENPFAAPAAKRGCGPPKNHAFIPGLVLLILGIIWLLHTLVNVHLSLHQLPEPNGEVPVDSIQESRRFGLIVASLLYPVSSIIAIMGGITMVRGRGQGTANVAAICACVPCLSPGLILGIPFGIWAIIALKKPETRLFFGINELTH